MRIFYFIKNMLQLLLVALLLELGAFQKKYSLANLHSNYTRILLEKKHALKPSSPSAFRGAI
jgi:hypothetical protein